MPKHDIGEDEGEISSLTRTMDKQAVESNRTV